MTDRRITESLRGVRITGADLAVEQAAKQIPTQYRSRRRRRRGTWAAAVLGAVVLGMVPPVQATAVDLANLVGVGDPPSDDFSSLGYPDSEATVVGVGKTPDGTAFEIALQSVRNASGADGPTGLYVSFPATGITTNSLVSLTPESLAALSPQTPLSGSAGLAPSGLPRESGLVLTALTSAPISETVVTTMTGGSPDVVPTTSVDLRDVEGLTGRAQQLTFSVSFLPVPEGISPDVGLVAEGGISQEEVVNQVARVQDALGAVEVQGRASNGQVLARWSPAEDPAIGAGLISSHGQK